MRNKLENYIGDGGCLILTTDDRRRVDSDSEAVHL